MLRQSTDVSQPSGGARSTGDGDINSRQRHPPPVRDPAPTPRRSVA
ncbi:hypothetical protein M6B38_403540 [Iris pallida]|uniref:Uncharacterized protein n=1 Tax=Iris pallida TaxID=29817 RepID=A0AAX6ERA9_IRIPA|nr:hypothetical protein M6B38_173925 [Iris pallida]KAJ6819281.1 hypothetical protein M6B38_403540 [Iris pallida]